MFLIFIVLCALDSALNKGNLFTYLPYFASWSATAVVSTI